MTIGIIFGQKASGGTMLRGLDLGDYQIPNIYRNLGIKEYISPSNKSITEVSLENSETGKIGDDALVPLVMINFERQQGEVPISSETGETQTCRLANVAVLKRNIGRDNTNLIEYMVPSEQISTPTTGNEMSKLNSKIIPLKYDGGYSKRIFATQIAKNTTATVIGDFTNNSLVHSAVADCISQQLNGEKENNTGELEYMNLATRERSGVSKNITIRKRLGQTIELPTLRQGVYSLKSTSSIEMIGKFVAETTFNWESRKPNLAEVNLPSKAFNFKLQTNVMDIVDNISPGNFIMTDFENEKGKVFERLPQKLIRKNATIRQVKFASNEWIPRERQFEGPKPDRNLRLNTYGEEFVTEQIRPNIAILESHASQNLAAGDRRNILESIHENTAQEILQKSLNNLKLSFTKTKSRVDNNIREIEETTVGIPRELLLDRTLYNELDGVTNYQDFSRVMDKLNVATLLTPGQLHQYSERYRMSNIEITDNFAQKYWGTAITGKIIRKNYEKTVKEKSKKFLFYYCTGHR